MVRSEELKVVPLILNDCFGSRHANFGWNDDFHPISKGERSGFSQPSRCCLIAHKTLGNSFTHFPFVPSNIFFNTFNRVLFVASTCPLLCGQWGVEYKFLMFRFEQNVRKMTPSNWGPLFVAIARGIPNLHTMIFQTNLEISLSLILAHASPSTHFLKQLVTTSKNFFCIAPMGKGPTMSIPYCTNDQGLMIELRASEGTPKMGACR